MPHAFRPAAVIEAENAQRKLDRLRDRWQATKNTWFDGSAESVEQRIANVTEVEMLARNIGSRLHQAKVGAEALVLLPQLRADKSQLLAMRSRITGGAWGDSARGVMDIPVHGDPDGQYDMRTDLARQYADQGNAKEDVQNAIVQKLQGHDAEAEFADRTDLAQDYAHVQQHLHGPYIDASLRDAAEDFIASENTTDRGELLLRAQRAVDERTWDWSPGAARAAAREFVGAVSACIPRTQRQAATAPETVADFDDVLMFG